MKRKNESGVVVVEALIVVTIVTMFITVMLYIGMILYQQAAVNIMANQAAASIAEIYGNTLRDPFTGYIDADGIDETVTYANMRNEAYKNVVKQKAEALTLYRLKSSRILNNGTTEVDVEIVPKKNELLKDQIVVKVQDTYTVSLISFFGVKDNKLTFEGTGRADCVDLLDYLGGVPALGVSGENAVGVTPETEYTVNFYKHYGDTRPLKTVTVLSGYSVDGSSEKTYSSMPAKPTQNAMRFAKWVTEDGHRFDGASIVNRDMNVYGQWECTVTFDPDGGTVATPTKVAVVGKNIELPTAERVGCSFAGWYTKKNGQGEVFTGNNVQGDITVYAKWECTVTFNPDGGTANPDSLTVLYGTTLGNAGYTLPTPSRTGCTFAGWYTGYYGEGTKITADSVIKSHTEAIAKWTCVVKFLDTNGTQLFSPQTVVAGKSANLQTPTRAHDGDKGWQFLGWKSADNMWYESDSAIEFNVDLYAQWECNHVYGDLVQTKTGTCVQKSEWEKICKYCSDIAKVEGKTGACSWEARCGKEHDLGVGYVIGNHKGSGYKKTTWGECLLCEYCLAPYKGWTYRNGQCVSTGMICIQHDIVYSVLVSERDASRKNENINKHVHG